MSIMNSLGRLAAVAVVAGGLAGCRSHKQGGYDYHVQVRNETSGVLRVLILTQSGETWSMVHHAQVYPNSRQEISAPRRHEREGLSLEVDTVDNPGLPIRRPLSPGPTVFRVTREGDKGPLKLENVEGP